MSMSRTPSSRATSPASSMRCSTSSVRACASRVERAMPAQDRPDEFSLIEKLFAPLAAGAPGALGLTDDAAVFAPTAGMETVLTVDAIVEGVHFLPDDPAGNVARKLLRVNLSDLAAK